MLKLGQASRYINTEFELVVAGFFKRVPGQNAIQVL